MGYSLVHVSMSSSPPARAARSRFVRRKLGVEAFGVNWFELSPGALGREHDEVDSGQEEVAVVVRGSGVWRVGRERGACP
jgi:uncharacterized cupin superfamily protein